jgi:Ni/Co efflux regulator RcnB
MKTRILLAAACALMCTGPLAMAQSHGHDRGHDRDRDRGSHHDRDRGDHHDRGHDHDRHHDRHHGRYHARHRYYRPHGWYSHRWVHGERLPPAWRTDRYYVTDYGRYNLRPPPRGYRWVRVDNDIVLVALTTGLITEALQDFFY